MQDLPKVGFHDVTPGQFRPEVPPGTDWLKNRGLQTASGAFFVAYLKIDVRAQERMASALSAAKPEDLKGLASGDFVAAMTKRYAELD